MRMPWGVNHCGSLDVVIFPCLRCHALQSSECLCPCPGRSFPGFMGTLIFPEDLLEDLPIPINQLVVAIYQVCLTSDSQFISISLSHLPYSFIFQAILCGNTYPGVNFCGNCFPNRCTFSVAGWSRCQLRLLNAFSNCDHGYLWSKENAYYVDRNWHFLSAFIYSNGLYLL